MKQSDFEGDFALVKQRVLNEARAAQVEDKDRFRTLIRDAYWFYHLREAVPGPPAYTLREALSRRKLPQLQALAKRHACAGYSRMRRDELLDALAAHLCSGDVFHAFLMRLSKRDWLFFCDLAKQRLIRVRDPQTEYLPSVLRCGYFFPYLDEDRLQFAITDEAAARLSSDAGRASQKHKENQLAADMLAIASANLYGRLSIGDFVDMLNRYQGSKGMGGLEELLYLGALEIIDKKDSAYEIVGMDIVSTSLVPGGVLDEDGVEELVRLQKQRARFVPATARELARYAQEGYHDPSPQADALQTQLRFLGLGDRDADGLLSEIVQTLRATGDAEQALSVVDELGLGIGAAAREKLRLGIRALRSVTRQWALCGHSPDSLAAVSAGPAGPSGKKPQRNLPCPCGSGKKYKHCCGKNL